MFSIYEYACTAIHRSYVPQLALNGKVWVPEAHNLLLLTIYPLLICLHNLPLWQRKTKLLRLEGASEDHLL